MSGIPDLELPPDGEFADDLEQLLMAEMGWEADVVVRPRSADRARPTARIRRLGITIAATLVAAAVIGLLFVDRTATKGPQVVPTASTSAPTTTAVSSATVVAAVSTTVPTTTTVPATAAAPTVTEVLPPGMPIAKPLPADTTYRIGRSVLGRGIQITNPVEGAWGQWDRGGFVLTSSGDGGQVLIAAVDLAAARIFTDPLVDTSALPDETALTAATSEPPADYLSFFAGLPGIEVGRVTDTEFAGRPARAMSWTFGPFEGGSPCVLDGNCVSTIWFRGTRGDGGRISTYTSGDAGTTYVLDLDGRTVVFEVPDRPGAQEAADSLVIGD
ncbi:MAG: hypothetical protein ABIO83_11370 [Ilumatobacteraceae bacterium]